ncbi:hypothetical protein V3W47_01825 [Deinococcus sp. YIM 134068]|uniref:hypothetical protein n=1 Tax=Deinococcus lichenicola TaxID=3118910 RepID=UPI002F924F9A
MERLPMTLALALLSLSLSSCMEKDQSGGTAATAREAAPSPQASALLAAALANPETASRRACVILEGLDGEKYFNKFTASAKDSVARTQAGYYQVSQNPFRFAFTQKYKDLIARSTNPQADTTRLCLGEARVQEVRVAQQSGPDKVIARGVTRIEYADWATEEVRRLFITNPNDPMFQTIPMVCTRSGEWRCDKR